jgi:hypothetical protein
VCEDALQSAFARHWSMERHQDRCGKIGGQGMKQPGERFDTACRRANRHDIDRMGLQYDRQGKSDAGAGRASVRKSPFTAAIVLRLHRTVANSTRSRAGRP